MKLCEDQAKLRTILKETITLLCRNGLQFNNGLVIDALIGITTDDASTFLLKLEETVGNFDEDGNTEADSDYETVPSKKFRLSRKRSPDGEICSKPNKQHCSDDDNSDPASDIDDVWRTNDDTEDYARNDVDNTNDDGAQDIQHEQDDADVICVKQEQACDDGQFALADQSQGDDTAQNGSIADTFYDGSSTQKQFSNDLNASHSVPQVRN